MLWLFAGGPGCARAAREGPPQTRLLHLEPEDGSAEMLGDGRGTKRRAIRASAHASLAWRLSVPPRSALETHVTLTRAGLRELGDHACRARLEIRPEGEEAVVRVERDLVLETGWQQVTADLHRFAGRSVELRLGVECAGAAPADAAALWSVPVVYQRRLPHETNVLLVTIDTLRPDHLGAYGYARATSPNIDALARRGLLFEHAETVQSATWPALTSLHTSLYPSAHGVVWNGHQPPTGLLTLARLLGGRGFSTSAFITNMKRSPHPGFSRLFLARGGEQSVEDRRAVEAALEQLRFERERKFFMWVHLIGPHASYDPPAPHDTAFTRPGASHLDAGIETLNRIRAEGRPLSQGDLDRIIGLYDGEVAWIDDLVGKLLDGLRELGLEEQTLVVFTADHGEDLYEHNRYFFHSPSMYGSSLRIPLVISLPGLLPEGEHTDHLASLLDIAPTVLGLLRLPPVTAFQGKNLLPGRALPAHPVREASFSETNGRIYGLRTPQWRFIYNPGGHAPGAPGGPYPIGEVELYRPEEDPREEHDRAAERADLVRAFTREIEAWRSRELLDRIPEQQIDPETLEELRALGYVVADARPALRPLLAPPPRD
jgi:arylsulfatase A-like enzyme